MPVQLVQSIAVAERVTDVACQLLHDGIANLRLSLSHGCGLFLVASPALLLRDCHERHELELVWLEVQVSQHTP